MSSLPSRSIMQKAFAAKDSQYDGVFFVGVKTTGVFCRPVCRAKPAKPENLEFFASAGEASRSGYRACKLCKPEETEQTPKTITQLLDHLRQNPDIRLTAERLREMGIDPSTARRLFQRQFGMTFAAYQRARNMGTAISSVKDGGRVITAQQSAGFESPSGFREAFAKHFGRSPRDASHMTQLKMKWLASPLGQMLAVADDEGIVLCDFFDRREIEAAIAHVRRRFSTRAAPAVITPGENSHLAKLETELGEYFAGTRQTFTVPLVPAGSDFERKAWDYLRSIPFGETRSYGQQAKAIGMPNASRAVGRANGMNFIAILIPCHRVIGANGKLTGYGGGVARKQWLLEHEQFQLMSANGTTGGYRRKDRGTADTCR